MIRSGFDCIALLGLIYAGLTVEWWFPVLIEVMK